MNISLAVGFLASSGSGVRDLGFGCFDSFVCLGSLVCLGSFGVVDFRFLDAVGVFGLWEPSSPNVEARVNPVSTSSGMWNFFGGLFGTRPFRLGSGSSA